MYIHVYYVYYVYYVYPVYTFGSCGLMYNITFSPYTQVVCGDTTSLIETK